MTGDNKKEEVNKEDKILEEIKKKLEECEKKTVEYLAGWQRTRADFLNYKKEEMEKVKGLLGYASEEWVLKILPILDNFEVAKKRIPENLKNDETIKGFMQIKTQIQDFLKNQGVEEIECLGKKFDPNLYEVVGEVEIKNKEAGIVIEEVQKGYTINSRLLRPVKVKVAK